MTLQELIVELEKDIEPDPRPLGEILRAHGFSEESIGDLDRIFGDQLRNGVTE